MTAFEQMPNTHPQGQWLRRLLQGSRSILINVLLLTLPVVVIIQGMSLVRVWLYQEQDALYFHAYRDTATNSAFMVAILILCLFYIHSLRSGIRGWQESLRRFFFPLAVTIPLLAMVLDSYVMINEHEIVHSPFYSLGVERIHSWNDVQSISVSYAIGEEDELFNGTYSFHFQDGTSLEIWKSGGMNTQSLQTVDREAIKRGIPFYTSTPLSDQAVNMLKERGWTMEQQHFITELFQRPTNTP
ncbi:hypothetical protein [Desmospora activa]|uniref:Uncharacterized protein n=1 Tax=Desmospora activa DSM 45169 TaxID=1121389 RepID=A0A2T4Z6T3_9BACL|nr:hypothetical protein [Desmospora activa]PTM57605.1 hypothetical protein C8J48_0155 [Desmospora activa DSM 45169]